MARELAYVRRVKCTSVRCRTNYTANIGGRACAREIVYTQRTGWGLLPITKRGKSALSSGVRVKLKLCTFDARFAFFLLCLSLSPSPSPLLRYNIWTRNYISPVGNTNGLLRRKISHNHKWNIITQCFFVNRFASDIIFHERDLFFARFSWFSRSALNWFENVRAHSPQNAIMTGVDTLWNIAAAAI